METKQSFLREPCTILLVTSQSSQSLPISIVVSILNVLTHRQYPVQYQAQGQCPDKKTTLHLFRLLYDLRAFFFGQLKKHRSLELKLVKCHFRIMMILSLPKRIMALGTDGSQLIQPLIHTDTELGSSLWGHRPKHLFHLVVQQIENCSPEKLA